MNSLSVEIPRFYTALAQWGASMVYIFMLSWRFKLKKTLSLSLFVLLFQSTYMVLTGNLPIAFWVPVMLISILIMFLFIYGLSKINIKDAAYYCIRAFILAELAASLERQIYWFFWPQNNAPLWLKALSVIIVYLTVFYLVWRLEKRYLSDAWQMNIKAWELGTAFFIGGVVFLISNISFISINTPFSSQYPEAILTIRTLVDIGGYAILYAHFVQCCQRRDRKEVEALNNVLQNQYMQYKKSKESIELINQKYHDLKHQITALRAEDDFKKREEWLDTIENDIKEYEAQNKTGNPVLDTVLTSKSLSCQKYNIGFTSVVNGVLLDFMDVRDISSIFGNALDNAIEYEKNIEDEEKRLIHVSVFKEKGFIILRFENYFEGQLDFKNGLPVTTKEDKNYHGYGLKSIRHIAKKYNGTAKVYTENNWFELNVLLPDENNN